MFYYVIARRFALFYFNMYSLFYVAELNGIFELSQIMRQLDYALRRVSQNLRLPELTFELSHFL